MPVFKVNVSETLAEAFDLIAHSRGRARSEMLRSLMQEAVGDRETAVTPVRVAPYSATTGRTVKVRVYLSSDDARWVEEEALEMGLTRSTWIAALVHHRTSLKPRFSRDGELALIAIHTDLRRIRLEVAALWAVVESLDLVDLDTSAIQEFDQSLRDHMRVLREAFEGNFAYWALG